jgi:hypothetical protein
MFGDDDLVAVYQRDLVVGSDQDITATTEGKPAESKKTPTTWKWVQLPSGLFLERGRDYCSTTKVGYLLHDSTSWGSQDITLRLSS